MCFSCAQMRSEPDFVEFSWPPQSFHGYNRHGSEIYTP